jgi:hypothetical protein
MLMTMPPAHWKSLLVREDTHRLVRFAAFLTGLSIADFTDQVVRRWLILYIQQQLQKPPRRLKQQLLVTPPTK